MVWQHGHIVELRARAVALVRGEHFFDVSPRSGINALGPPHASGGKNRGVVGHASVAPGALFVVAVGSQVHDVQSVALVPKQGLGGIACGGDHGIGLVRGPAQPIGRPSHAHSTPVVVGHFVAPRRVLFALVFGDRHVMGKARWQGEQIVGR